MTKKRAVPLHEIAVPIWLGREFVRAQESAVEAAGGLGGAVAVGGALYHY